ncbi:MAG: FeoC-like transcriptional regulator [Candidatus Bathyarchaeia archaeon]|jgi:predicted transcriptional regulator of viral defense system
MIKEVLKQIHQNGVVNLSEISQNVGVSPQMVDQAIAILQSKGYLKAVTCGSEALDFCPSCRGCHGSCKATKNSTPNFFVTEKGKQYINSK